MIHILLILIVPLAAWRISNLLSDTSQVGPMEVLSILRSKAGMRYDELSQPVVEAGSMAEAMLCIYCNSIWIGLFFTLLVFIPILALIVALPFALSTTTILLDKIINSGGSK